MRRPISAVTLLSGRTTTGSSNRHTAWHEKTTFQAVGRTTAGSGAASINIEVSNVENPTIDAHWLLAMTIDLTLGTTDVSDGQEFNAKWKFVRARVVSISGTGASVDVYMGG